MRYTSMDLMDEDANWKQEDILVLMEMHYEMLILLTMDILRCIQKYHMNIIGIGQKNHREDDGGKNERRVEIHF